MKKHFRLFFDIVLFGIPLFVRLLLKVKQYHKIINDMAYVKVDLQTRTVSISLKHTGKSDITLLIDRVIE